MRYLVALAALVTAGGCAWVAGVSGDTETTSPEDQDGAAEGNAGGPDGASDASGDAPIADGGAEGGEGGDIPPGGRAPDGAVLGCGNTECVTGQQVCCYAPGLAPGCQSALQSSCTGTIARCDEALDCDGGVCCVVTVRPYGVETVCRPACDVKEAQACHTNSECPAGKSCTPWRCASGLVETCGGADSDAGCLP